MAKKKTARSTTGKKPTEQKRPASRVEMAPAITVPIRAYYDAGYAFGMYGCGGWASEAAKDKLQKVTAHLLNKGLAEGKSAADETEIDAVIAIALHVLAGYVKARSADTEEMCRTLRVRP